MHVSKDGRKALKKLHEQVGVRKLDKNELRREFDLVERFHLMENSPGSKLHIELVKSAYRPDTFELYKCYQMNVHKDPEGKVTKDSFERFLCESPLEYEISKDDCPDYGSYHQLYFIDNKLIAFGVIDILPKCLSSVYFVYDPSMTDLALGKISAYKEASMVRELYARGLNDFLWYCMGFYIHSCQKMRYKGAYRPSFLLDRDTYEYVDIEKCLKLLDKNEHTSFVNQEKESLKVSPPQEKETNQNHDNNSSNDIIPNNNDDDDEEDEDEDEITERRLPNPPPPGVLDPSTISNEELFTIYLLENRQLMQAKKSRTFANSPALQTVIRELVATIGKDLVLNNDRLWIVY